ncbi:hypothetical protein GCM10009127_06800 [Alteraurantiacibacter aestuarii]|uniref:Thioredoxin family protein n=1 Tax=Alteraurantiacibacter aestuarii TaxID=650004 RepID=A0A844ZQS2_9SPHN|nr:thioredoxin family protein [Alteraurantiacibacter aestuarii]MXO89157.1 thioredoxin family protein [Alteraurantiacibacter aestuarii]
MRWLFTAVLALCLPALAACTTVGGSHRHAHAGDYPEAALYDASADAALALDTALALAAADAVVDDAMGRPETRVLAIFGANWCHDSRALAGWLQTERFQSLINGSYRVVYIDAGVPQTGEGRNLELAAEYGVADVTGTPTVLVLGSDGKLLNTPDDARSWRNASSRSEDEIFAWLEGFTRQ